MRKVLFITLLGVCILHACKKESAATPRSQTFTVQINGVNWSESITSWASSGGTVQLNSATKANGSFMQVFIPEDTVGTFNASENVVTISYNDGTTTYSNNISGTVTVSTNSANEIEGTFELLVGSFFASDTLDMKQGAFYWKRD